MSKEEIEKIELPPRAYIDGGAYGDMYVASQYCGYKKTQPHFIGEWQHGWIVPERNIHPEFVIGSDGKSFGRRHSHTYFVARQDQVDYLKSIGYKKVFAIGMPILYLQDITIRRIPGSLLVMPGHSLPDTNEDWDMKGYADYINSIASRFSKLCLCVHKSCVDKGNWINAFDRKDIEIVEGADEKDANSLRRMATLFSQFEYMTSNEFGSHVAYASYFGCKASIAGPRLKFRREYYENATLYRNAPEVLDIVDDWYKSKYMQQQYSQFYINPWEAKPQSEWAAWQLGLQCKRTPEELHKLFRWDLLGKVETKSIKIVNRGYRGIKRLLAWT